MVFDRPASSGGASRDAGTRSRYTKQELYQTLQFLGCKPRRAEKACNKLFLILEERLAGGGAEYSVVGSGQDGGKTQELVVDVVLSRMDFENLIMHCLGDHPRSMDAGSRLMNLQVACKMHDKSMHVMVVLCGTSGTGKSTLASLVASRLGIAHVLSTDAIRHMLRGFSDDANLFKSTYEPPGELGTPACSDEARDWSVYLAQRNIILEHVEHLMSSYHGSRTSLVIEGVHLGPKFVIEMMNKYDSIVPFLIYISNESKHIERFAVRAKAMTLRPESNRYVKHFDSIRNIQDMLQQESKKFKVPQVDNTNVDRSLATIHSTVLGSLRRVLVDGLIIDAEGKTCAPVLEEFEAAVESSWSSSAVLNQIQRAAVGDSTSTSLTSTTDTRVNINRERGVTDLLDFVDTGSVDEIGSDDDLILDTD